MAMQIFSCFVCGKVKSMGRSAPHPELCCASCNGLLEDVPREAKQLLLHIFQRLKKLESPASHVNKTRVKRAVKAAGGVWVPGGRRNHG